MKYTGRIISLLIVAMSSLGLILYNYLSHDYLDRIHLFVTVFYLFLGWWLGYQYDKAKYLSEKDILTGCYTRRFVMDVFPRMKSLSDSKAQKIIIFLMDVDDFKSINDQYGHATGDYVLQRMSRTLKKACRDSDYIVRWGGDEFVGIFPCSDQLGMNELHIRLHNELNKLSSRVSMDISMSVGYAMYPDDGVELNDLIKVADRMMYNDKRCKNNKQTIRSLVSNGN